VGAYTKVNLRNDVDDQAVRFGLAPDIEFRMARVPLELEHSGVSYQRLAPNFRIPFGHVHKQQEEVYILVSGSARVKLGDEVVDLEQWDAVRVAKETMRGFEAGPQGAELIVVGAPNTGPGDADMEQEWWSD
jgi:mannose-6-phosphate isomerase-like protein (cupin superfamily)